MKYRHVGLLSVGHLATDINQGALPAMLPFFIAAHDLSYAAAAGIVFPADADTVRPGECLFQPVGKVSVFNALAEHTVIDRFTDLALQIIVLIDRRSRSFIV